MKTIGLKIMMGCILIISFAVSAFAQTTSKKSNKLDKSKVPTTVTETYVVEYPVTAYETWYGYPVFNDETDWYGYDTDLYTDNAPEYYIVEFNKDGTPYKVIYTKEGAKVATHKTVMVGDVPKPVADAVKKSPYKGWTITKEKEEIFRETDNIKVYKVVVEKGNEKHALFYQEDGKLLKDKKRS